MKHAAVYNPYWDSLGGGERYCAAFIKLLLDNGYQVDINWPDDLSQKIYSRFGINISQASFKTLGKLKDYDLVFWVSDGSVPTSRAKRTIIHFQVPFHDSKSGRLANVLKLKFYQVVCNSFFTKSFIDKTYHINSTVIHPPVDVNKFSPATKKNQIISLARFSRRLHAKRQDTLIQAFSKLRLKNWKLVLAGGADDPAYLSQLKSQAGNLPVYFVVDPTARKIVELLGESKIFWSATGYGVDPLKFPEKMEHFGITPVEAMAARCVPIVTAKGGHLETVVQNQSGYLYNTIEELVKYTTNLAKDASMLNKISYHAQARSKNFSTEVFNQKFAQLL